jgi:hypothetical protein
MLTELIILPILVVAHQRASSRIASIAGKATVEAAVRMAEGLVDRRNLSPEEADYLEVSGYLIDIARIAARRARGKPPRAIAGLLHA